MDSIYFENIAEIRREKELIEKKLGVKIVFNGKKVVFEGEVYNEYEARNVLEAISLGFSARTACTLVDELMMFEKINIKDFTRRKDLEAVKGRVIGTHGRTKQTIEDIAGCEIVIKDNTVAIIGRAEDMPEIITAVTNLIRGTKQGNIYSFLEKRNAERKLMGK